MYRDCACDWAQLGSKTRLQSSWGRTPSPIHMDFPKATTPFVLVCVGTWAIMNILSCLVTVNLNTCQFGHQRSTGHKVGVLAACCGSSQELHLGGGWGTGGALAPPPSVRHCCNLGGAVYRAMLFGSSLPVCSLVAGFCCPSRIRY